MANIPCWDQLQKDYPMTLLDCSSRSLGLPEEQILVYACGNKPLASCGGLSDLAPAMQAILYVEKPAEMTGRSLIINPV
jgi:bisphosphoglycerate-independent phosphoglycerate mutase (AlkP superfamily)